MAEEQVLDVGPRREAVGERRIERRYTVVTIIDRKSFNLILISMLIQFINHINHHLIKSKMRSSERIPRLRSYFMADGEGGPPDCGAALAIFCLLLQRA